MDEYFGIKRIVDWGKSGTVLIGRFNSGSFKGTSKIAAFDFDHTIAVVDGTHVFPKNGSDWKWFCPSVPFILLELSKLGYSLVIVSNQLNIEKADKRKAAFQGRIEKTCKELQALAKTQGVECPPMLILASVQDDEYRKPRPGMWNTLENLYSSVDIDKSKSFYCGDAAGRDYTPSKATRKDHTDTDRKWAYNVGIVFYVPQQLFDESLVSKYKLGAELQLLDQKELPQLQFDPRTITNGHSIKSLDDYDLLICVGSPGAGKTHYCKQYLNEFHWINQDVLKTLPKCLKEAKDALDQGKKVVVDNTNPTVVTRSKLRALAEGKRIACLWFKTSMEICYHNNLYRQFSNTLKELNGVGTPDFESKHVPNIALHSFWKNLQVPTRTEGFDVIELDFAPRFANAEEEFVWRLFYH